MKFIASHGLRAMRLLLFDQSGVAGGCVVGCPAERYFNDRRWHGTGYRDRCRRLSIWRGLPHLRRRQTADHGDIEEPLLCDDFFCKWNRL